jgi:ligand-binding sensor domain-containing protein
VKRIGLMALLAMAVATCEISYGATSSTWDTSSASEFLKGRLRGLSLTSEGWLQPGPAIVSQTPLNEPVLWSLIPAGEGGVYASTGHGGKVYHVDRRGKSTLIWQADQPEVFALCTDSKGRLYAGTSPNGGVFRIDEGKAVEIAHLDVKYIWALAAAADDSLFVATGENGRIFHLTADGKTEVYFDTGQGNVTSLALGYGGHLYAGSEPNGLL